MISDHELINIAGTKPVGTFYESARKCSTRRFRLTCEV